MEALFHHLAQVNIARMRAPLDDPSMSDFVSRIDEINALADSDPGFVWRWTDSDNGPFTAPDLLFNLSVWKSVDALRDYVYRGEHAHLFRDRLKWFLSPDGPTLALWWIPAGQQPTPAASKERLEHLAEHGPTPFAFSFKHSFLPS
jgi:hypothetical protein